MLEIILWIVIVYFFLVFVAAPLLLPHMRQVRIPEAVPPDLRATAERLSREHQDDRAFLRAALNLIRSRYTVWWWQSHLYPWILFRKDITAVWNQVGEKQSCNVLNFVVKAMLVSSGRFSDVQVTGHLTFYHWNVHQYLAVETERGVVYVDPWGYLAGRTTLGEYAAGFGKKGAPIRE